MQSPHPTLESWLTHLATLHPLSMDFTLSRIETVYRRLNLDKVAPLIISVAGTNGKGSTSTTAAYLFEAHGADVGLFTSPHIFAFNERIRINQKPMDDASIIEAFEAIEAARESITLTYFEFATLAALYLFKREAVDVAILEVGLGGRLDSTNIVDADIAIITPIGIDHTAQLGETLEEIAHEKAGIIKQNAHAVLAESSPNTALLNAIHSQSATKHQAGQSYHYQILPNGEWSYQYGEQPSLILPPSALYGRHQYQNAAAALTALYASPYRPEHSAIATALTDIKLLGRFQAMRAKDHPTLYLDVTHNPQGAAVLRDTLKELPHSGKIIAIYGALRDKDAKSVASCLNEVVDQWICVPLNDAERGQSAESLAMKIESVICHPPLIENSLEEGCKKALSIATKDDILILFGSFHMIDKGINWFNRHDYE